jgi:hypothetical protein
MSNSTQYENIDEHRLDSDYLYRFQYLAKGINFTAKDVEVIQSHREFLTKSIVTGVSDVLTSALKYSPTRKILLSRIEGYTYTEEFTSDIDELTLESEVIVARIKMYCRAMVYIICGKWDEDHVLDLAKQNGKGWGNPNVPIDPIHDLTSLGIMLNRLYSDIMDNESIPRDELKQLTLALNKIGIIHADITNYAEINKNNVCYL